VKIYALSDLHLSLGSDKPMDIFGAHWHQHHVRMAEQWDELVGPEDVVLCPGDLSWAMRLEEAAQDLAWIGERSGKTIILGRGNHDYWWGAIGKVRAAIPEQCVALQNDAIDLGEVVICGGRCWSVPGSSDFSQADEKIYKREIGRLEMSLVAGQKMANGRPLIGAIHYPPFTAKGKETIFSKLLEQYGVKVCVYGHLHGQRSHSAAFQGERNGVRYHLVSCDALHFRPTPIWPDPSTT
jgi:uncharacterized protein